MTAIKPLKDTKIFNKIKVGQNEFSHRVTMVPTTRYRALDDYSPSDLMLQLYDDRTKTPGSFVITEAALASPALGVDPNIPGIWTDSHVQGWKKITDAVHKNGSFIGIQLWSLGRLAQPEPTKKEGYRLIAPSAIYPDEATEKAAKAAGNEIHVPTTEEIEKLIKEDFVRAGKNALAAGFDYIELHGAHGYLIDTFMQSCSNKRTDKYGGSIENRARFALEIIDALIPVVGAHRLAIRLSPWARFQGMMGAIDDVSPVAQFGYFISELQKRAERGQELAYISLVEPRVFGYQPLEYEDFGDNTFVRSIWKGILLRAGNYTYDAPEFHQALADAADDKTLIGFGRYFTSNPDFVERLRNGKELTEYVRELFYAKDNWGYNTFGKYGEKIVFSEERERQRKPQKIA